MKLQATVFLIILIPATALANWLGGVEFSQPSGTAMPLNEYVEVSIDYKVTHPDGARIFLLPYSEGAVVPTYAVSPSPLFASGTSGTYSDAFFGITAGNYVVDALQIRMTSADQTEELLELFVDVEYPMGESGIFDVEFSADPYDHLIHDESLVITFDYATVEAANVRVFARPYANGELVPGYGASGSALLPPSGSGSQSFSFGANADITDVRFRMTNADQTEDLLVVDVPLPLFWREVGIRNLTFDKPEGSWHNTDQVNVTFDYTNATGEDVFIWTIPTLAGNFVPGINYLGSTLLPPGAGSETRYFQAPEGEFACDAVRVLSRNADQTFDFVSTDVPAGYSFGPHAINGVTLSLDAPAILDNGENLSVAFDYTTSHDDAVLIFVRPFFQGGLPPGYGASGSPPYPSGSGSGSGSFTFPSVAQAVDQIRFQMTSQDQSETLFTWFVPVDHFWGTSNIVTGVEPVTPAVPVLGRNYPNPFNPTTTIPLNVPRTARYQVRAYDLKGRLVRELNDGVMAAGQHRLTFDGADLPSGSYLLKVDGPGVSASQRMMLVK